MRFFDDLVAGERRQSGRWRLTEESLIAFASEYDPQYFHIDPAAAKESPFGGLIVSGIQLIAIARRLDQAMNSDIAYICGVALEEVRFLRPGRAGDDFQLCSEIDDLRASRKDAGRGYVGHRFEMTNQHGEAALSFRGLSLVRRRQSG